MVTVYYTWVPDNLEGPREGRWLMPCLQLSGTSSLACASLKVARPHCLFAILKYGMRALRFEDFNLIDLCFPRGGKPYCNLLISISHILGHGRMRIIGWLEGRSGYGENP